MAPDDFAWLPTTDQLAAMDAKEVSSAELVDLYLSRIDEHNASLNAIVTIEPDAARRERSQALLVRPNTGLLACTGRPHHRRVHCTTH
jgi:amidase